MSEFIIAPWSDEQVVALNAYQRNGKMHAFTCGNDRGDDAHRRYARTNRDRDFGLLVAAPDGWRCPVCDYRQIWAHAFMAVPARSARTRGEV